LLRRLYCGFAKPGQIPRQITDALQDAMEIATENVPEISGKVYIFPDISGSMHSAITGFRKGSTSAVRCIDAAALFAAAILRKNPTAEVIPFESDVVKVSLNARDSIMTNAQKLASLPAGGTNCSAPLRHLNRAKASGDVLIYVSDNESWIDTPVHGRFGGSGTETMKQWNEFKSRNRAANSSALTFSLTRTRKPKNAPTSSTSAASPTRCSMSFRNSQKEL
jgi:60 kDa SS-A/Ro ribonucleoprotein